MFPAVRPFSSGEKTPMYPDFGLSSAEVLSVFTEEITARGGRVTDTFHDGRRLFTRSVLPYVEEVRSSDRVQGGVALKATEEGVWLHPYLFRLVCRNGAIIAEAIASQFLGDLREQDADTAARSVRESVGACCARDVFRDTIRRVRSASERRADVALNLLPLLSRFAGASSELVSPILEQFFREADQSQFGLANAITAIARDTRDPDLRWNLEEFGGGIMIGAVPRHPASGGHAAVDQRGQALLVG
jgi:hypothetical protein